MVKADGLVFYGDVDFITNSIDGGCQHVEVRHDVWVDATKIHQNGRGLFAELAFHYKNDQPFKECVLLNLQDNNARYNLAIKLAGDLPDPLPWGIILDYVCAETIRRYRLINEPQDASAEPESLNIEYAIQQILPLNLPTTIYSPGGRGKSIIADYLAVIYEYGIAPDLPLAPRTGHVLYLDWESDIEIHRKYIKAIKGGLGIMDHREIAYLSCTSPLTAIIEPLRQIIYEKDINLVIIDSQMAATAGAPQGISEAQLAAEYYNCLNSLKVTTLTIDHVSKEAMKSADGSTSSPYGSIVKYNRARSIYEIRSQQEIESDHMEIALVHTKYNLGRKQKPLGIAIDFENVEGELRTIKFSRCDLADNPVLNKALPCRERVYNLLLSAGTMPTDKIASELEIAQDTLRATLNRYKKIFVKIGDEWGILENEA